MTERNAEPELVSLAILDVCERAARELAIDYDWPPDEDSQFMAGSLKNWQSRIKVLKLQAAAGWQPRFQAMLDQAHSICIEEISYPEKEAVRTKKMRCMACGRWEKRCKYGLNAVGSFDNEAFNCKGASQLTPAWNEFRRDYEQILSYHVESGELHPSDMGLYSIGETCMRKAQIYYQLNTLLLNEVFEAYYKAKDEEIGDDEWVHATEEQAEVFLERFQRLQACAADDKRTAPSWGTDKALWETVDNSRSCAANGNDDTMGKLLRARAERFVGTWEGCDDSEPEPEPEPEITRARGTRKRPPVLEESDESESDESDGLAEFIVDDNVEAEPPEPPKRPKPPKRVTSSKHTTREQARHAAVRKSRRVAGRPPDEEPAEEPAEKIAQELGPREEGGVPVRPSRAPAADPFRVAQARRAPQGRLPARRECLIQLVELQLQLVREGRDGDASVCTNAIMTLQELMTRVEQLAHTA